MQTEKVKLNVQKRETNQKIKQWFKTLPALRMACLTEFYSEVNETSKLAIEVLEFSKKNKSFYKFLITGKDLSNKFFLRRHESFIVLKNEKGEVLIDKETGKRKTEKTGDYTFNYGWFIDSMVKHEQVFKAKMKALKTASQRKAKESKQETVNA